MYGTAESGERDRGSPGCRRGEHPTSRLLDERFLAATHGYVVVAIHLSISRLRTLQLGMDRADVNGF